MRQCSKCNAPVADESRFCTTCGVPMAPEGAAPGGTMIATQVLEASPGRTVLFDSSGTVPVQAASPGTIESTKEDINKIFETSGVCPQCYSPLKKGSHACEECGYRLTGMFCKSCGREVTDGQDFCPVCKSATVAVQPGDMRPGTPPAGVPSPSFSATGPTIAVGMGPTAAPPPPSAAATVQVPHYAAPPSYPPPQGAPPLGVPQSAPAWTPPYAPPAPAAAKKGKGGMVFLIIFLILILGGGGFSLWYFVLKDKDTASTATSTASGEAKSGAVSSTAAVTPSTAGGDMSATANPLPPADGSNVPMTALPLDPTTGRPLAVPPGTSITSPPVAGTTRVAPPAGSSRTAATNPVASTTAPPVNPATPVTPVTPAESPFVTVSVDGSAMRLPGMNAQISVNIGGSSGSFGAPGTTRLQLEKGAVSYSVTVVYTNAATGEREQTYTGSGNIRINYPDQRLYVRRKGETVVIQ